ncbi:T9SS C-terminal target domain-containing protein [Haliscomenobacter hydrossis]|uniref:PKD domain containing protein n=1 Tax=Haliscomenobacter hydrossis (strain ATCC 27775 / DSM 1100 / LMG 10767 / O) TaxID=760192 RepID=F4KS45_HALH1|nr:T9SS C-terminal target domain-containing protein [Haliscomenobacter hydrossis]AEE52290.1 hypothetical protein Halhy_4449 [Haliscomenobacter hydrossis DSM 1100]
MLAPTNLRIIIVLLFSFGFNALHAQQVINSTGNSTRLEIFTISYSVGETAVQTLKSSNGSYLTQGVLQPQIPIPSKPLVTLPFRRGVCLGEAIEIEFSTLLVFAQDNEFTIELSDENGSFANPNIIGKVKGTTLRKVPIQVPSTLKPVDYLIRVVSSSPKEIGQTTNLLVRKKPNANFTLPTSACTGDTVFTTFTGKDTIKSSNFIWNFTDGLLEKKQATNQQGNIWSIDGTKKTSLIIDNDGCKSDPVEQNIKIERRIAPAQITCGTPSGNSITFNWSQVGGATDYKEKVLSGATEAGVKKGNSLTFPNVAPGTKIKIEVQATGPGACGVSVDTQTCTTIICPSLSATLAQNQVSVCAGEPARTSLTLGGARGVYRVVYTTDGTKLDTLSVLSGQLFDFFPEQNTNYTFLAVGNAALPGCYTTLNKPVFQVRVTPNNFPGKPEAALLVCDNQESPILLDDLLKDEFPGGKWSSAAVTSGESFDSLAGTFIPKGNKAGKYFFVYTVEKKNGCNERAASVEINVEQKSIINIKDYSSCTDSMLETKISLRDLSFQVNPSAPNTVRWYTDQALSQEIREAELIVKAERVIYGKSGQGVCASGATPVTLKLSEEKDKLPLPVLEGPSLLTVGDILELRTSSSYPPNSLFYWQRPDSTLRPVRNLYALPPIRVNVKNTGRYTLYVQLPQGKNTCISPTGFIDIQVIEKNAPKLQIKKIVGENSPWIIEGIENYQDYTINIFNRWGELVHSIKGPYLNDWKGTCTKTCNGEILPQGTYYYEISIKEIPKKLTPIGALYVVRTNP